MYLSKTCREEKIIRMLLIIRTLLFAVIWSQEAHSWSGLNYMYKAKYKTLEN